MNRFLGLVRHEFNMSVCRKGLWIAYGMLFAFHTLLLFSPAPIGEWVPGEVIPASETWSVAGRFLVAVNVFFPVVAGILSADRIERDLRIGVRELQGSTPLSLPVYILAKYLAAVGSCLLPLLAWVTAVAVVMTAVGHTSGGFILTVPVAFLAISVPAFAFVIAFSLACPLVMPLSVYQILLTGYWFWANFVPPGLFPTPNGTLLTPSGMFVLQGWFGGPVPQGYGGSRPYTALDAGLNLAVLALCSTGALLSLERFLRRRARLS